MRICDVCKSVPERVRDCAAPKQVTVTFVTEQNEGRPCKPYEESANLDVCKTCADKMRQGAYIKGSGAQGSNNYNLVVPTYYETVSKIINELSSEEKRQLREAVKKGMLGD